MRRVRFTGITRIGNITVSILSPTISIFAVDAHLISPDVTKKDIGADFGKNTLFERGDADIVRKQGRILADPSEHQLLKRSILYQHETLFTSPRNFSAVNFPNPWWIFRNFTHSSVNFVISDGIPKFETVEFDPPKQKWKTTKKLKLHRKKEKQKRKAANRKDPRHLGITGNRKRKFASVDERIKYKLEKARIKEALLVERLKQYEVPKLQGPLAKPVEMTGEERFYMKKKAQKSSNYVPVGKRGIFGGVILNMHLHWKKHETVKVICKPCKPGQVQEYANEIARLSGGIPIQVIGNDTIVFYRGKDYVQPKVMSPVDTLSKKRALEKSKYEQSLETVRHFIAIAEKELELYYRHIALYGEPAPSSDPISTLDGPRKFAAKPEKVANVSEGAESSTSARFSPGILEMVCDSMDEASEMEQDSEDGGFSLSDSDSEEECVVRNESDSHEKGTEDSSRTCQSQNPMLYC